MPPAAGFGLVGSMIEYRSFTSDHGVYKSHLRPRFTVSRGLIFQSSCAYRPVYQVRSPITASLTYILELSTLPNRKLANSLPVVVRSGPLGNAVSSAPKVKYGPRLGYRPLCCNRRRSSPNLKLCLFLVHDRESAYRKVLDTGSIRS